MFEHYKYCLKSIPDCTVQQLTVQDTASVAKKGHEIREQLKEGEFSAKIVKS